MAAARRVSACAQRTTRAVIDSGHVERHPGARPLELGSEVMVMRFNSSIVVSTFLLIWPVPNTLIVPALGFRTRCLHVRVASNDCLPVALTVLLPAKCLEEDGCIVCKYLVGYAPYCHRTHSRPRFCQITTGHTLQSLVILA